MPNENKYPTENDFIKILEICLKKSTNLANLNYDELERLIKEHIISISSEKYASVMMNNLNYKFKNVLEIVKKARKNKNWSEFVNLIDQVEKILVNYDKKTTISMLMLSLFLS